MPSYLSGRTLGGVPRMNTQLAPQLVKTHAPLASQIPGAYAKALLDPEKNASCIIPDLSCYPTETYSLRQSIPYNLNSTGQGGILVPLQPNMIYFTEATTTTDALYAYNTALSLTGAAQVQSTYSDHRLVGCSVRIEFAGNDNNNQGRSIATSYTYRDTPLTSLVTQTDTRNTINTVLRDGCEVIYKPLDSSCFDMKSTTAGTVIWGQLQIHVTGGGNLAPFVFHITQHWEGVTNNSGIGGFSPDGAVYVKPEEFNQTMSTISGTPPYYDGKDIASGKVSNSVNYMARDIYKKVETLNAIAGASYSLYKMMSNKRKQSY